MAEDWKKTVVANYEKRHQANSKRAKTVFGRTLRPLQLTATLEFVAFVDRAAQRRDVNRSTYVRRTLAVAVARDLGVPVRVVLWESPKPGGFRNEKIRVRDGGERDEGQGIEDWCPHPGCDGAHLAP
jgi:hypothetical protein